MKKFILALCLTVSASQSFGAASFLAGLHDKYIALGGLLTTTTISFSYGALFGLVVFADNGEAYINLGSEDAKEALKLAVQKSVDGEILTNEDKAILEIYANQSGMDQEELIQTVAQEL